VFEDNFEKIDTDIWGYEIQRGGFGYVIWLFTSKVGAYHQDFLLTMFQYWIFRVDYKRLEKYIR
jgi:hypothetical protein